MHPAFNCHQASVAGATAIGDHIKGVLRDDGKRGKMESANPAFSKMLIASAPYGPLVNMAPGAMTMGLAIVP